MAVQSEKSSLLIPERVGAGTIRRTYQNRTLAIWTGAAAIGLTGFKQNFMPLSPGARAAFLGLLFPGAGYIACANITAGLLFLLSTVVLPVTLLAWFGAGGILFPFLLWTLDIVGAYFLVGRTIWEPSWIFAGLALVSFVVYLNRSTAAVRKTQKAKRLSRNQNIPKGLDEIAKRCVDRPADADRELTLDELRIVQFAIDVALQDVDDWSNYTIMDQFQTAALRYQLYELVYDLGVYQGTYVPNFHGYLSAASRQTIEKSLTPKVLNFWKWETLWGKFSTDFDPVKCDNIMVTGYLLQAIMLYTANTGDLRYTKPESLPFEITKKQVFKYDLHRMDEALVRQWKESPYCLFSCEPNWIYTPCNFQGMAGQLLYDRVFGTNHVEELLPRFEKCVDEDFTELSGSILPIRSELTGFSIPGLIGAISDLFNAVVLRGYLDHIATRMYAMFVTECINLDTKTGDLTVTGLVGADHIDPGLYRKSEVTTWPLLALAAGEYGDETVRKAALRKLGTIVELETTPTGARRLPQAGVSLSMNTLLVRGTIIRNGDWRQLVTKGPSKTTLSGPILADVPYPGVLVAKARSHTGSDLDLVLYPSADEGNFTLGVERLIANSEYEVCGQTHKTDGKGRLSFTTRVAGRTVVKLEPVRLAN